MGRILDIEKKRDIVKFLCDECIPHDFVSYMYKQNNYTEISKPNLTYQKASSIVKNYVLEESDRINLLKFKIEEKFPLIHYIYLMLFSKIYNRTNNFGIQNKNNLDFYFQTWKNRKTVGAIVPKFLKQLPLPQANQITTVSKFYQQPKTQVTIKIEKFKKMNKYQLILKCLTMMNL